VQKDIIEKLEKEKIENGSEKKPEAYMFKDNTFYLTKRSLMNQFNEMICNNEKKTERLWHI
jgi:hypothetical protein